MQCVHAPAAACTAPRLWQLTYPPLIALAPLIAVAPLVALAPHPAVACNPALARNPAPCRRLAGSGGGDVFMTDDVLSTLMCATRSNYPWVSPCFVFFSASEAVLSFRCEPLLTLACNASLPAVMVAAWAGGHNMTDLHVLCHCGGALPLHSAAPACMPLPFTRTQTSMPRRTLSSPSAASCPPQNVLKPK